MKDTCQLTGMPIEEKYEGLAIYRAVSSATELKLEIRLPADKLKCLQQQTRVREKTKQELVSLIGTLTTHANWIIKADLSYKDSLTRLKW